MRGRRSMLCGSVRENRASTSTSTSTSTKKTQKTSAVCGTIAFWTAIAKRYSKRQESSARPTLCYSYSYSLVLVLVLVLLLVHCSCSCSARLLSTPLLLLSLLLLLLLSTPTPTRSNHSKLQTNTDPAAQKKHRPYHGALTIPPPTALATLLTCC